MESQLQRPHGHAYDDPQNPRPLQNVFEEGDHEHHHQKKSVLKKVKDKAKKIKHTIQKHGGHGQEQHEHEHGHDHEEEEDEDEEMFEDPEIHGAPIYESAAIRSSAAVPSHGVNLEKPTAIGEDRYGTKGASDVAARVGPGMRGQQQFSGESGIDLEKPTAVEVAHAAQDKNVQFPAEIHGTSRVSHPSLADKKGAGSEQQGVIIGKLEELEEDPNYVRPGTILPSNYETKVTDPAAKGGKEAGMDPLIQSLDKMTVSDESVPRQTGYTGSHDQFAPQTNPIAEEFHPKPEESTPKSYDPSKPEELPRDTLTGKSSDQGGYVEKISAATSIVADKAISAKNVVVSKLGYGPKTEEMGEGNQATKSASPTDYAHKVAAAVTEKLAPVYDKVADAGSTVISKVKGGTDTGQEERSQMRNQGEGDVADKGVSVKGYLAEKFKPGEEDKALSEMISETLHKKKVEETGQKRPITGKVTESEEVKRYLGGGTEKEREGDDAIAAGSESSGKGVVERIKDAVGLWVNKGYEDKNSEGSTPAEAEAGSSG